MTIEPPQQARGPSSGQADLGSHSGGEQQPHDAATSFHSHGAIPAVGGSGGAAPGGGPSASDQAYGGNTLHDEKTTDTHNETKAGATDLDAMHADSKTFTTMVGNEVDATSSKEAKLLNDIRYSEKRFDPRWLMEAQSAMAVVDATGAMNTETLRAMRKWATDKKWSKELKTEADVHDKGFLATIHGGEPFMASTSGMLDKGEHADPTATTEADRAAQRAGFASYKSYVKHNFTTDAVTFLGHSCAQGQSDGTMTHHLHDRLKAAEAFLEKKYDAKGIEAAKKMKWNGKIGASYDNDASLGVAHPHTMGIAIDIDPNQNPFIFNNTKANDDFWPQYWEDTFKRVAKIYGTDKISAEKMWQMSEQMSTEELYVHMAKTSEGLREYMALGDKANSDDFILDKMTELKQYTREEAKKDLKFVRGAYATFHGKSQETSYHRHDATSITNIQEDLLIALRDVAGLAWGGTEMNGAINGDFMHFDCRYTGLGQQIFGLSRYDDPDAHDKPDKAAHEKKK